MEITYSTGSDASILNFTRRNNSSKKKVLFACVPADGHFNPLMPLADHLKELGHDVRWYTSPLYAEKISKHDMQHYPFKAALDVNAENVDAVFPERKNIKGLIRKLNFDLINGFIVRSTEYYTDIKEIQYTFPFDIVIADCMFMAVPFIKNLLHVPVITIGVVPLTETSKDIAPTGLGLMPATGFLGRRKQDLLRFLTNKILFRKSTAIMRRLVNERGIKFTASGIFDFIIQQSSLLLQTGVPGFEYKRSDLSSNIRFIGASLPHTGSKNSWYHHKLLQYDKVILVTQGTVEKDVSKLIIPTLEALKNSEYLVIATTGGSHTNELAAQFNYDNIIIEDFIPFDEVMPLGDVFITNGGYGGVTFAIEHQLPMVVAGIHEGKSEINARVEYFKIGVNLRTERPSSKQIKAAVEQVFNNGSYRKNVERLSNEFSTYNSKELFALYVNKVLEEHSHVKFLPVTI
jgi:MGT family glycosyltransferase